MSSPKFEGFLARLYSDERFASRFMATPEVVLDESGLEGRERCAALAMDPLELQLTCASFAAKRATYRRSWRQRLRARLQRLRS